MRLKPKKGIESITPPVHGGIDLRELAAVGLRWEDVMDFSVCCNPYPPLPELLEGVKDADIGSYPDPESTELRTAVSRTLGIGIDNIIAGNGSTELIRLIAQAYIEPGDRVLVAMPTYSEYELASRIAGAQIIEFNWNFPHSASSRLAGLCETIDSYRPKIVFLCNPNNPTGHYLNEAEVRDIYAVSGGGLLVIDEAYVNFTENKWNSEALISRGDIAILRSMTKDCGIAGLRLGYALAPGRIIEILRRVCPPWNVSAAAQRGGAAVLSHPDYLDMTLRKTAQSKKYLSDSLSEAGYEVSSSKANFFLVRVGDARSFRQVMLGYGILVRDCTSFGLPEYIRIGARTEPECEKLIDAMKRIKKEGRYAFKVRTSG